MTIIIKLNLLLIIICGWNLVCSQQKPTESISIQIMNSKKDTIYFPTCITKEKVCDDINTIKWEYCDDTLFLNWKNIDRKEILKIENTDTVYMLYPNYISTSKKHIFLDVDIPARAIDFKYLIIKSDKTQYSFIRKNNKKNIIKLGNVSN